MATLISRTLSVLVVGGYVLIALWNGGIATAIMVALFSAIPLACIWIPEVIGSLAYIKGMPMNETPDWLVVFGGWLLLLLPLWAPWIAGSLTSS